MKEAFLHHLWKFKLLHSDLKLTTGECITVVHPGTHNHDAGPDFFNAKIKIDDILLAGNVEVHVKSSDFLRHGHQYNLNYDQLILHVVLENDSAHPELVKIPTLVIKDKYHPSIANNFDSLVYNISEIPCSGRVSAVSQLHIQDMLAKCFHQRLQRKHQEVMAYLERCQQDWEQVLYLLLLRTFGQKINAMPFELLAFKTPISFLRKHRDQLFQIEAILFGQAGLLHQQFTDEYPTRLKNEYLFLKSKFNLNDILPTQFKFLRLRPANFPTLRIAQVASLIHHQEHLFSKLLYCKTPLDISSLFSFKPSAYWNNHYRFDLLSKRYNPTPGQTTMNVLILNVVIPILYSYAYAMNDEDLMNQTYELLRMVNPEDNKVVRQWIAAGITPANAQESQSLLTLKAEWCDQKKCLLCTIGNQLINQIQ